MGMKLPLQLPVRNTSFKNEVYFYSIRLTEGERNIF